MDHEIQLLSWKFMRTSLESTELLTLRDLCFYSEYETNFQIVHIHCR